MKAGKRIAYQPRCAIKHRISVDKMSRSSLEKRWYGLGATRALMDKKEGASFLVFYKFWYAFEALRFVLNVFGSRLFADEGIVFQHKLELLRAWGYLKTNLGKIGDKRN